MGDENEDWADEDVVPALYGRHFLVCRSVWFDSRRPEDGFGLAGIYTSFAPSGGATFPFRITQLFAYVQLWGNEGEYRFRIRLVKIETHGEDEIEVSLGAYGEPREFPLPTKRPVEISTIEYVQQIAFGFGPVFFPTAGTYEFQLWADGIDEPVSTERIMVSE